MNKPLNIKKIDLRKIIIAPLYKKTFQNQNYIGVFVDTELEYKYANEWIAIYSEKDYTENIFYNLLDNLNIIRDFEDEILEDDYLVNLKLSKPLTYFLHASKYKYDIKYLKFKDLLYLIEPIIKSLEYSYEKDKKIYEDMQYDSSRLITAPIYVKNKKLDNHLLEEHEYFAIDTVHGVPVSYGFINKDIPYILKNEIIKKENNKFLVRRLLKK